MSVNLTCPLFLPIGDFLRFLEVRHHMMSDQFTFYPGNGSKSFKVDRSGQDGINHKLRPWINLSGPKVMVMRRIAPAIPVPKNMFRHFAVVTVLITACIALFADGERRDAIGAEIGAQKQKTAMVNAEAGSLGPNKTSTKKVYYPAQGGGGDGDSNSGGGDPMVNPVGVTQHIADDGTYRMAHDNDYGRADYNPAAPSGPPGSPEIRQGMTSSVRIGTPRKRTGSGANPATSAPTEAQRNAIYDEGFRRAGPPTPPTS